MPVFRYFTSVGATLLLLLVAIDAMFGTGAGTQRFNDILYDSALYAPRVAAAGAPVEHIFAEDVTPADRVREVFGQFSVNDSKRLKRYSSRSSAIW
ncbi:MAG: hypothetical protein QM576_14775 [Rhodopseudomonas sp.]|uniref:hypothetical protein n=1 Tax=Rhodopseudomonas sp. TaxID=1078 RepID=UPI0039E39E14